MRYGWLVLLIVAAGIATTAARPHSGAALTNLRGCASPAKFQGVHRGNYVVNCQVCRVSGWRAVRRDYHIASKNPVIIALRYAQKTYRPAFQKAVYEGCLRGFKLRRRP